MRTSQICLHTFLDTQGTDTTPAPAIQRNAAATHTNNIVTENTTLGLQQNQIPGFNELERGLMYRCHGVQHLVIAAAPPIYKLLIRY